LSTNRIYCACDSPMEPNPIRVIAYCSLILGAFFVVKNLSIKSPKYVLHELLAFKVNKGRFFRKHISQKLEAVIAFVFLSIGCGLLIYLEVEALQQKAASDQADPYDGAFTNLWAVLGTTLLVMVLVAWLLNRITRFFSGKIFVEMTRFMVLTHKFPLEKDHALVRELGAIMNVPMDEQDTLESYSEKVRAKMHLGPDRDESTKGPFTTR